MPEFTDVERAVGTYRSKFVALDEAYPITPRTTGVEERRWRWVFQHLDPKDPDPVIDAIASPGFKQRSNNLRFLTGMLGRAPRIGDKTEDLLGQDFDVDYGPNLNGRNTIVNVRRVTPVAPQNVAGLTESAAQVSDNVLRQSSQPETATFRDVKVPVTDPRVLTPTTTPEGDGGTEDDQLPF